MSSIFQNHLGFVKEESQKTNNACLSYITFKYAFKKEMDISVDLLLNNFLSFSGFITTNNIYKSCIFNVAVPGKLY